MGLVERPFWIETVGDHFGLQLLLTVNGNGYKRIHGEVEMAFFEVA